MQRKKGAQRGTVQGQTSEKKEKETIYQLVGNEVGGHVSE